MKDKQIQNALDSMLSGLEVSADLQDKILNSSVAQKSRSGMKFSRKIWVIVIIALMISAVCGTTIGMPMLRILTRWDDQVFAVKIDMEKPMPGVFIAEKLPKEVSEAWGTNIADIMYDLNACTKIPTWIPERFILAYDPNVMLDTGFGDEVILNYIAEDGTQMALSIRTLPQEGKYSGTSYHHHDNTENEVWVYDDIEYILLKNYQYHSLNWQENNCSVSIWGEFTRDEALQMVKSIYE